MGNNKVRPERHWKTNLDSVDVSFELIKKHNSKRIYFQLSEEDVVAIERDELHWVDEFKNEFRIAKEYAEEKGIL